MTGAPACCGGESARSHGWLVPLVFLTAAVVIYLFGVPLLNDNDVPWHLATGTYLLQTHHLPRTDPFAYGNENQPWYILSWLWDLVLGMVQQYFGALGVYLFTVTLGAGLTAATCGRLLKRDIALPAVLVVTGFTCFCLHDFVTARGHLVGYALALAFAELLHRSRADVGYRHLRWLPLLMLVWVNAHGSFVVGFMVMGAYAVEAWFTRRHDWLKRLIAIGLACLVCCLLNPYGPQIITGMMRTLYGTPSKYTAEWQCFYFGASTGLSIWVVMFVLASSLRHAPVPLADKVLSICWFIGTMMVVRNGPFFILLSAPYLAACLDEQTRGLRKAQPLPAWAVALSRQPMYALWQACTVAFLLLCGLAYASPHAQRIESRNYRIRDAIDFIMAHYPDYKFYADYNFSGEIPYYTQGKLHYFMDSRAETAYSSEAMKHYLQFQRLDPGWEEELKARGLNGIIAPRGYIGFSHAYETGAYHDRWKLVFEGVRVNVYVAKPKQGE